MFPKIVNILQHSERIEVSGGTLHCYNYIYSLLDKECFDYLNENNCIENTIFIDEFVIDNKYDLELSLYELRILKFYYTFEDFVEYNKYVIIESDFFIYGLANPILEENQQYNIYKSIMYLIESINKIAKHRFSETGIEVAVINRNEGSLLLPLIYNAADINQVNFDQIKYLNNISSTFNEPNNEKKLLFINELIEFLSNREEETRFRHLLFNITTFNNHCNNSYQYYLRDFSSNKLKLELDSKALDYIQKIQSMINESQTKLIAIPTVFVLACVAFDFEKLLDIKNIATLISLFIFAILIQLFINNQKSSLRFIKDDIREYKESYKEDLIKVSSKFSEVTNELSKQRTRFYIVEIILWIIPIVLLLTWLILTCAKGLFAKTFFLILIKILLV